MDVKFSNNLFLAVAELNKLKQSLGENGWKLFAKNLVKQFGIAQNSGNTMFMPIPKTEVSEVITVQPGIAFDSNMNAIILKNSIDISVPASQLTGDLKYWLILRHSTNHYEEGVVSISADGALTGTGTNFLKVLRGQPDFPTKIRLESQVNIGDYEVVAVSSSTSALLAGNFTAENNLRYSVIGTFTPGFIPNENDALIYEYDSYEIEVRISAEIPTLDEGNEFVICSVGYVNAVMELRDYRVEYMLNNPYAQTLDSMKKISKDEIVSLVMASIVSMNSKGIMMELQLQHGFKVLSFETNILSSGYVIDITNGECNYIDTASVLPNSLFKGWYLLNRDTMSYSVITDSTDKRLFISELNPDSVSGTDIVIVPPFKEIEYQITIGNNVPNPGVPYISKFNIENIDNKVIIPILFKDVNENYQESVSVSLKYRMVGSDANKYQLFDFSVSGFYDYDGVRKSLANSSFNVPIKEIQSIIESKQVWYFDDIRGGLIVNGLEIITSGDETYYPTGSAITLVAVPKEGYVFDHWEIDGENVGTQKTYNLIISKDNYNVSALFVEEISKIKEILYEVSPSEYGKIWANGINPSSGDVLTYEEGTIINLSASINADNYEFDHWEIDDENISESPIYIFTVSKDHVVKAYFKKIALESLQRYSFDESRGSVSVNTNEIKSGDETNYPIGTTIILVAGSKSSNYVFSYWKVDGKFASANSNYLLPVSKSYHEIEAFFTNSPDLQSVQTFYFNENQGTVSVNGEIITPGDETNYPIGTTFSFKATPKEGYVFDHWELRWGDGAGESNSALNPYSLEVRLSNYSITAVFESQQSTTRNVFFSKSPVWGGELKVDSVAVGNEETKTYDIGTIIQLDAVPKSETGSHWLFDYWEIDGERVTSQSYNLTISNNHSVKLVFKKDPAYASWQTFYMNDNQGFVRLTNGTVMENGDETTLEIGTVLQFTAVPKEGYVFDHWEIDGENVGTQSGYTLPIRKSQYSIRPIFVASSGIKVYVTSNVVDESSGYATITVGSKSYSISSSYKTAVIDYAEGMIMSITSSSTKTFSKWQYSTDGVNYSDIPSTGNTITVSGQESDCYFRAIFN